MPKQPTDKDAAEAAIIQRIDRVMACFISEESGMTAIPAEEVGNVVRACGCYLPEIILMNQLMPSIQEDDYEELGVVRPELLKKRIVAMAKERTWEADTETELTNVFRKLDTLAHNGEEYGYIEMDKMQRFLAKEGMAPMGKEEIGRFADFAVDKSGSKFFYHDYVGKVLPLLDDDDFLDDGKSAPTPLAAGAKKRP